MKTIESRSPRRSPALTLGLICILSQAAIGEIIFERSGDDLTIQITELITFTSNATGNGCNYDSTSFSIVFENAYSSEQQDYSRRAYPSIIAAIGFSRSSETYLHQGLAANDVTGTDYVADLKYGGTPRLAPRGTVQVYPGTFTAADYFANPAAALPDQRVTKAFLAMNTPSLSIKGERVSDSVFVAHVVHDPFASAPASVDFGTLPSGAGPRILPITIENLGTNQLVISDISFSGPDADKFRVGAFTTINGGSSIDVDLTFDPAGTDGNFVADLIITSDDPVTPVLTTRAIARVEVTDPLVAHWPLDTDASDASGKGFDGMIVGGTVNFGQAGANRATGRSASFPNSGHIDIPFSEALNPRSFTVTLWAYVDAVSPLFPAYPIYNMDGVFEQRFSTHGFAICISPSTSSGSWAFWTGGGSTSGNALRGAEVKAGTWTHLAISYDELTDTKRIFIDGVDFGAVNVPACGPTQYSPNGTREMESFHIGSGGDDGTDYYYSGRIDDVGLFRVALSEAEIADIMNNGVSGFTNRPPLFVDIEDAGGDMLTLRWVSKGGFRYNVRSETGLSTETGTWPIHDGNGNLAATPPENTLTIPRPAEGGRLFVIEAFPAQP